MITFSRQDYSSCFASKKFLKICLLTLTLRWTPVPCLSSGLGQLHRPRVSLYCCSTRGSTTRSMPLAHSWHAVRQTRVLGGHCRPGAPLDSWGPGDTRGWGMWRRRRRKRRRTMGGDHSPTDCSFSYKGLWENGREGERHWTRWGWTLNICHWLTDN